MEQEASIREECAELAARLARRPQRADIHRAYLDLATLTGRIEGTINTAARAGDGPGLQRAQAALDAMKASTRRVGLDIRLASDGALLVGLESALESGVEALNWLERDDSR